MTSQATAPPSHEGRWLVAVMGTVLQIGLGTVYAWSFFQKPMKAHFAAGTDAPIAWVFSLSIFFLGFSAAIGGVVLPRLGPRKLALAGALLYPAGWLLGSVGLSHHSLPILYLGYGAVGGIGLGLAYVTPVATVAKWFPDRRGLVTGMVLMGFGLGALTMAKVVGPALMKASQNDLTAVFLHTGIIVAAVCLPAAAFLRNPPARHSPVGDYADYSAETAASESRIQLTPRQCLWSWRFAMMWMVFFCNVCAGIMFIGFQSPMLQEILKRSQPGMDAVVLGEMGAMLIAVSSLSNGIGRMLWGGVSDRIGRVSTFRFILASEMLAFVALSFAPSPGVFALLVCYVMLGYGGGFGTMPSFVLDTFGARVMPVVYGGILTAWSMAGIAGPQLVARIKDSFPTQAGTATFLVGAGLLATGLLISLFLDDKAFSPTAS